MMGNSRMPPAGRPRAFSSKAEKLGDNLHLLGEIDLGQHVAIGAGRDRGAQIGLEELAAHRVDADQPLGAAKVQRLKDLDDRPPRLFLLAEGDAVLQIHHDAVHTQADGLFDLAHRVAGHEQHRAA